MLTLWILINVIFNSAFHQCLADRVSISCKFADAVLLTSIFSWFLQSGEVREKSENQKKSGNFAFQSQGKLRGSGKVREFKSIRVQKLTKMQKKIGTVVHTLHTTVRNFFCSLCSLIICMFAVKFVPLPLFPVWLEAIKLTLVFRINKLDDSFCPGKSGKSQGKWILQSSRKHVFRHTFKLWYKLHVPRIRVYI